MIRTEAVIALAKKKALKESKEYQLRSLIRETYQELAEEATGKYEQIQEGLESMRTSFIPEMLKRVDENGAGLEPALEKRVQINTVAEVLGVHVNELLLYFLNCVKTTNEHQLVEYHMQHVYFYAN